MVGRLPHRFDVRAWNEQQVERTFAEDLISNVNVVALHILGCGSAIHPAPHGRSAGNARILSQNCGADVIQNMPIVPWR